MPDLYLAAWLMAVYAALLIDERMATMTPKIKRNCPKCGKLPQSCSCKKGRK